MQYWPNAVSYLNLNPLSIFQNFLVKQILQGQKKDLILISPNFMLIASTF